MLDVCIRTSCRDPRNNDHRVVRLQHGHHASVRYTKSRGDFGAFDDKCAMFHTCKVDQVRLGQPRANLVR